MDSLAHALFLNARRFPNKPAIVFAGNILTYAQLMRGVYAVMAQLKELGVSADDKVAIVSEDHPEFVTAIFAITGLGAVPALVNYRLPKHEMLQVVRQADSRALIIGEVASEASTALKQSVSLLLRFNEGAGHLDDTVCTTLNTYSPNPGETPELCEAHSRIMCHTSGTTGLPKGVLRSRWGFEERSVEYGISSRDSFLNVLPICLTAGLMFSLWPLYIGSTLYLHRSVDYSAILADISEFGINTLFLLNDMLNRLIKEPGFDNTEFAELRHLITAGGYIPLFVRHQILERCGPVLSNYYGSSEIGPSTILSPEDMTTITDESCIGRTFFGSEVVLLDDNGKEVSVGEPGTICVRNNYQLDGYYKQDALMAEITTGPYFSVGDIAKRDADGYFYFLGRKRDFIRTGGINVPTSDIERSLVNVDGVAEVVCVGIPHADWGEAICAVIVAEPGATVTEESVMRFARAELPGFKRPKYVVFRDSVPKNLAGRVLKHELSEELKNTLGFIDNADR